jgi:hypothetical protein
VAVPCAEDAHLGELVRVVEVEQRVPDHLEHGRDAEGRLRCRLEVEQQARGDHVGVGLHQGRTGELGTQNAPAWPRCELGQQRSSEYLAEPGELGESRW